MLRSLIVGGGGREHALAWKMAQSKSIEKLYAWPGNAGMAGLAERVAGSVMDVAGIGEFAEKNSIDLVVVGPESPLIAGVADELRRRGVLVFGPSKEAARMEGSKSFAKRLMLDNGIPTAGCEVFAESSKAIDFVKNVSSKTGRPIVVKADGEAAGKGVFVCSDVDGALAAVDTIMNRREFGSSGDLVVIEEYLDGPEATLMYFVDGDKFVPMTPSQDHKRAYDGDEGPNTGGMGCYSPVPALSDETRGAVAETIIKPTLAALARLGIYYSGVLYCGLALTAEGPKVVEFNSRFGDPETQVVMPLLDGDLAEICLAVAEGNLDRASVNWYNSKAVCVVMASGGYPGDYEKGKAIAGIEDAEANGAMVFHAGTEIRDGKLVTSGGRVLGVTALGDSFGECIDNAYTAVDKIHFEGAQFRRDIGYRLLI